MTTMWKYIETLHLSFWGEHFGVARISRAGGFDSRNKTNCLLDLLAGNDFLQSICERARQNQFLFSAALIENTDTNQSKNETEN